MSNGRLRVLQIVPCLSRGGAERLVLNLSAQLKLLGHEVLIVQLRPDIAYEELKTDLNIELANSSVYYSVFGKNVINTSEFDQIVDEFRPDVIHSHLLDSEFVSRNRIVKNTAYITHWHGCPSLTQPIPFSNWFSKESIWKWNTKRILKTQYAKSKTHFLCISNFIGKYIQDRVGVKTSDLTVIHNAIDLTHFRPMNLEKKAGFRLISIGSLQRNKNHRFLFEVMRKLLDNGFTDIHLDVCGVGPEMQNLQDAIEKMQIGSNVKLHGVVSDPEKQLNQSHLLVHSAWHEPFGLVFIEAMACGIPVVSFNTGGPAELITDGLNGYLVEKDDLTAFAAKVKQLYENREQMEELGKHGIEHAKTFGLTEYAKKVENLYNQRLAVIRK